MEHYPVKVFYSAEDKGHIAVVPDLPGCSAFGKTEEEAIKEARVATSLWIKAAKKDKRPVPRPSSLPAYSGKFVLRIPKTLHQKLAERAGDEGVSLNQYVEYVLAEGMNR